MTEGENHHPPWQEEFHIYGMVTTIEDHKLPQAEIDEETYIGYDVPPQDCEACQKEYYNRPRYARIPLPISLGLARACREALS